MKLPLNVEPIARRRGKIIFTPFKESVHISNIRRGTCSCEYFEDKTPFAGSVGGRPVRGYILKENNCKKNFNPRCQRNGECRCSKKPKETQIIL